MRKTLLIAIIGASLAAPIANAQVSVGLGGGGGINVGGPVNVGGGARGDIDAASRTSRVEKRAAANADAQVDGRSVRDTAMSTVGGTAAAGAGVTAEAASRARDTARAGAQAAANASAQAVDAVSGNATAAANSAVGAAGSVSGAMSVDVAGQGQVAGSLQGSAQAAAQAAGQAGANAGNTSGEAAGAGDEPPAKAKPAKEPKGSRGEQRR